MPCGIVSTSLLAEMSFYGDLRRAVPRFRVKTVFSLSAGNSEREMSFKIEAPERSKASRLRLRNYLTWILIVIGRVSRRRQLSRVCTIVFRNVGITNDSGL